MASESKPAWSPRYDSSDSVPGVMGIALDPRDARVEGLLRSFDQAPAVLWPTARSNMESGQAWRALPANGPEIEVTSGELTVVELFDDERFAVVPFSGPDTDTDSAVSVGPVWLLAPVVAWSPVAVPLEAIDDTTWSAGPFELKTIASGDRGGEVEITAAGIRLGAHAYAGDPPEPRGVWLIEPAGPALLTIGGPDNFVTYYLGASSITELPSLSLRF